MVDDGNAELEQEIHEDELAEVTGGVLVVARCLVDGESSHQFREAAPNGRRTSSEETWFRNKHAGHTIKISYVE